MFVWKKMGRVFEPQTVKGLDWLQEFSQAPAAVLFDDFVRIYFSCRPRSDSEGRYVSYSSFIDLDRSNLLSIKRLADKPILELGCLGEFDQFGTYPVSVARNKNELWAYYGGWTRCESVPFDVAIGLAISTDGGINFKKVGRGPILGPSLNEPFVISGPKIRYFKGCWWLFYIAGKKWKMFDGRPEPVYKIRAATSPDGINWEKLDRDLISDRLENDEAQASPDVFFYDGRYHMFFCYRYSTGYRGKERGYRIGYAYSSDLVDWVRDDSQAGIHVSQDGWDSEMVSYPHVFEVDGKLYLAYLGNQVGRFGFGLAVLERTIRN